MIAWLKNEYPWNILGFAFLELDFPSLLRLCTFIIIKDSCSKFFKELPSVSRKHLSGSISFANNENDLAFSFITATYWLKPRQPQGKAPFKYLGYAFLELDSSSPMHNCFCVPSRRHISEAASNTAFYFAKKLRVFSINNDGCFNYCVHPSNISVTHSLN